MVLVFLLCLSSVTFSPLNNLFAVHPFVGYGCCLFPNVRTSLSVFGALES